MSLKTLRLNYRRSQGSRVSPQHGFSVGGALGCLRNAPELQHKGQRAGDSSLNVNTSPNFLMRRQADGRMTGMRTPKVEIPGAMAKVKRLLTLSALIAFQGLASGQEGKAPTGWYPEGYKGHTFTGVLQSVDESTHHLRLTHAAGYKTEVFVGVLVKGYTTHLPDGSTRPLKVSDLPIGEHLTVYYMGEAKGSGWRKVHKVFLIEGYPNLNIGNTSFMSF